MRIEVTHKMWERGAFDATFLQLFRRRANPRGLCPLDFKSNALTTRPSQHASACRRYQQKLLYDRQEKWIEASQISGDTHLQGDIHAGS